MPALSAMPQADVNGARGGVHSRGQPVREKRANVSKSREN
jgi:hypothetical protein